MLKLFYVAGSCSLASHIALEESGLAYETAKVDFANNEQRGEAYLRLNPKGRVPALITDQGVITETPAILTYIAQSAPQAALAPFEDAFAFARLQSFCAYLCATVHVAHAHKMRGYRWATDQTSFDDMRRKVPDSMTACFGIIEDGMIDGPWVMGDQYTIADPYLFTLSEWLEGDGVDVSRLPKVIAHRTRMAARPAVQEVLRQERG